MTRNEEILASITEFGPDKPTAFQGKQGHWCQADAVFIELSSTNTDPASAILAYREKFATGSIAVEYNSYTDMAGRLRVQDKLSRDQNKNLDTWLSLKSFITEQGEKLNLARKALEQAEEALASCYDVSDYPAKGESSQDIALAAVREALEKLNQKP